MQKSLMKLLGVAVLTWSSQAAAVGMGGINVSSALGQPLKASIELKDVMESEKTNLTARLASTEAYKAAGLDFPYGITFAFEIDEAAKTIKVSSTQPIDAPFVSLLVELSWASGKLLRDFTFLIDPVGYSPEIPKLAPVQPVSPDTQTTDAPPISPAQVDNRPLVPDEQALADALAPHEKTATAKPRRVATESVKIKRGDTLNKVAAQVKPAEVSLDRMMVALYRANRQQFVGNNMNRVKTGTILRLPTQQEMTNVSSADAKKEIHAQVQDWNQYRQQLASNSANSRPSENAQQSSSGKIGSNVTDKTPVANDPAKGVLQLSSGDAPKDKTTAQDKRNAAQEDAIAKAKAAQDEQAHAALAAKAAEDAKHLLELKSQALASNVVASAASTISVVSGVSNSSVLAVVSATASTVSVASAVAQAASLVKATPPAKKQVPPPVEPEKSFVDEALAIVQPALDEPLYLAGGAAILLSLGGLAFALNRRKNQPAVAKEDATVAIADAFSDVPEQDEDLADDIEDDADATQTARFYQAQNAASYQPIIQESEEEEDPIEEARLFLSFGRDAQAEDILKDALKKTPNNDQIHLELLGIYANRKDINAFAATAHQLKESGNEALWAQAVTLGRKLEPSNPLYGAAEVTANEPSLNTVNAPHSSEPVADTPQTLDFDLGAFTNKRPAVQPPEPPATEAMMMPFDMTVPLSTPMRAEMLDVNVASATAENPALSGDSTGRGNIMFDVTATHPTLAKTQAAAPVETPTGMPSFSMDFTLPEMPAITPVPPVSPAPVADSKASMPFTIDFASSDFTAKTPVAADVPVASSAINTIDFALPDMTVTHPVAKASAASPMDTIDFAIPLDLTSTMPAMATAAPAPMPLSNIDFSMTDLTSMMPIPPVASQPTKMDAAPAIKLDFGDINLNLDEHSPATTASSGHNADWQEIANKLDLAKVYIEMDDTASAREFLEEVLREGDAEQIATAQSLLKQIA